MCKGPNNRASNSMKQKLTELKEEIDKSTFLIGNFNISLSNTDRTIRM